jgi:uncharacterized damage-inducible protein DinB
MTEKEMFLQAWEREFQTTLKVLKAYPANKLDFKPHERSRSAKELAWNFASEEQALIGGALKGQIDFQNLPKSPATFPEIIRAYETSHKELVEKVKRLNEDEFNKLIKFNTGPKKVSDLRKADIFWTGVQDTIHHRGQFSVYLRMAGGKVPSIYGPSADEPWM